MLKQKLILSYSSQILIQFTQIAASIVVARIAGPTVLGTVAFGLAFVSMFTFIADLGIGTAHIKMVSEGKDLARCISTYTILKISTTGLFFLIVLGLFLSQKYILHNGFESKTHEYVILIMLTAVTLQELLFIPKTTFAGRTEQAKQDIPDLIRVFIYQVIRIIVVLLGYRAIALALGNLISTILIIPVIFYVFRDYPHSSFDKELAKRYFKIALPIMIIGMSTKVINYLDVVGLQFFTNSEQVGYYTAGFRIGGFVRLIANSVGLLFFPLFSKAAANANFQYIENKIHKFERISFLFIMPSVILVSIYSETIVKIILGDQYIPSIPVMSIIAVTMFITVLNVPYDNVLTGMGFFKLSAVLNLINLGFYATTMFLLVNPVIFNLGAKGSALTIFLSNIFMGILFRIFAKKECPILNIKRILKFFLYGTINFMVFYYLYRNLNILRIVQFKIFFIFVYLAITCFSFYLLKWINKEDWKILLILIDIKSMIKYIDKEIRGKHKKI